MQHPFVRVCVAILILISLVGCRKSIEPTPPTMAQFDPTAPVTASEIELADVSVLFIGNSHSSAMPRLLTEIYTRLQPDKKVVFRRSAYSGFLDDHAGATATLNALESGPWDFVVLQAQKYSTSGKYDYPTDGAIILSELASKSNSKILMYPEWSRRGSPDEYARIRAIHDAIAKQTGAAVAPIGEAWENAILADESIDLYDIDGNHASKWGEYLNACVFYVLMTGENPERPGLPPVGRPLDSENASLEEANYRVLEKAAYATLPLTK